MTKFTDYADKYSMIKMRREDGILEMRFHTDGGPFQWSLIPHAELEQAFLEVGRDYDNEVVILTGTGDEYCGPLVPKGGHPNRANATPKKYDRIYWEAKHLLNNLLNIEVPVISAINGPAVRHPEIPLLSDIILASDTAYFMDSAHYQGGMVPGDGVHIVFPLLMGANRARYFMLTGQKIPAEEAKAIGLVNPELKGKLDGISIRVPTPNVSVVDFKFIAKKNTTVEEINNAVIAASKGKLKGVLAVTAHPNVSIDFNHDPSSSTLALDQTKVMDGNFVSVLSWYDNEWGFSNRMADTTVAFAKTIA